MDTYIAAQKLPVSYTLSGNVTVVSVIGNTVTARIPMDTITAGFVKFSPTIPASSSADSPGYDNVLAVDATGVYTFYGSGGWGKSPRYTTHWDDLTENVRFLKVDAPMSLTSAELANAYDSLELHIATRDTIGLVKGAVSRTASISIPNAIGSTLERIMKYGAILDLVDYLPQSEGSTTSWQAGVRIAADGSMSLPYADHGTPGAVLLGGNNPFAAATVGSVYAVAKWVIDYVTGIGSNLAESYAGTGGDRVTAAGAVSADWQGGTVLVDAGRAYVPDATSERKGIVLLSFAEADSQALVEAPNEVPLVPTVAKAMELDTAMKEDILRTYPNTDGNPAGVVNPQGAILLQDASTNAAYSGAIDIRAAGTGMYGGVYVSDDLSAQDESVVVGPLVDFNNEEYPVVPTTGAVTSYVDSKIEDVLEAYSFGSTIGSVIQQPSSYASTTTQGVIRLGPGLENVSGPSGNTVTQVQDASETVAGKVYVIQSTSSSTQALNAVPSIQYVEELIDSIDTEQPAGSVSTPGIVYVSTSEADNDVPVLAGYNRVPTVDYMKSALTAVEDDLSAQTLTYADIGVDYRSDTITGGSLKQSIYEDVLNWVGTVDGGAGGGTGGGTGGSTMSGIAIYDALGPIYSHQSTSGGFRKAIIDDIVEYATAGGGTGSGDVNIYDTLIGNDSRDFRDVQAAQQYANMARRAQLNYSITLGTSLEWLGDIAWHSDVSTILNTAKSAAGNSYSLVLYSAAATATYSAISQVYSGGRSRWSNFYPYSPIPYDATGGRLENDLFGQVYNTIVQLISLLVYNEAEANVNTWLRNGVLAYIRDRYVIPSPGYTIAGIDSWSSYSYINGAIYKILERLGEVESRIANIPTADELIAAINEEAAATQISLTLTQQVTDSFGTVTNSGSVNDATSKAINANYVITDNGESGTYTVT